MSPPRAAVWLLAAALGLCVSPAGATQKNTGVGAAEFLRVGAGARALGMGEAYGPVAEGAEAIYWNPAGLAQLRRPEFTYTRSEFLEFFHHDFAAYAHPVPALHGTLALAYTRLSQTSLPLVTNANVTVGRFSPHSDAAAIAYARTFELEDSMSQDQNYFREAWNLPGTYRPLRHEDDDWTGTLMVGVSVKAVSETLHDRRAQTMALDAGALFRPSNWESLRLSAAVRNAGGKMKFIKASESLPAEASFGLAYEGRGERSRLIPAVEAAFPYYGNPYAKIGVEYEFPVAGTGLAALRAGYKSLTATDLSALSGLSAGAGIRTSRLGVDMAFQPLAELGQVYRLSLALRW